MHLLKSVLLPCCYLLLAKNSHQWHSSASCKSRQKAAASRGAFSHGPLMQSFSTCDRSYGLPGHSNISCFRLLANLLQTIPTQATVTYVSHHKVDAQFLLGPALETEGTGLPNFVNPLLLGKETDNRFSRFWPVGGSELSGDLGASCKCQTRCFNWEH